MYEFTSKIDKSLCSKIQQSIIGSISVYDVIHWEHTKEPIYTNIEFKYDLNEYVLNGAHI